MTRLDHIQSNAHRKADDLVLSCVVPLSNPAPLDAVYIAFAGHDLAQVFLFMSPGPDFDALNARAAEADTIERQNAKLIKITEALMRRVEQKTEQSGLAYAQFERAALLEAQVRQRTQDLERTLDLLHDSNAQLAVANRETEAARSNLAEAIETVDEGFALFDAQDRLVMSNSRFCKDLSDIKASIQPGLAFKSYVDLIGSSRFLSLPAVENRATWTQKRMQRHTDNHVVFNVSLVWDRWLQVSEHRTASGGTVILQTDVTGIMRLERRERAKLMDRQAKMVRATLDHINQGVCIFGHDGRLVGWNMQMETLLNLPIDENVVGLEFAALVDRLGDQFDYSGTVSRAGLLALGRKTHRPPPADIRS
ncbi:Non-motile and phage-resistance protein [Nymphon striatum]|nr:Non-motile and phage-resistance protein [Nymphon striatum]